MYMYLTCTHTQNPQNKQHKTNNTKQTKQNKYNTNKHNTNKQRTMNRKRMNYRIRTSRIGTWARKRIGVWLWCRWCRWCPGMYIHTYINIYIYIYINAYEKKDIVHFDLVPFRFQTISLLTNHTKGVESHCSICSLCLRKME